MLQQELDPEVSSSGRPVFMRAKHSGMRVPFDLLHTFVIAARSERMSVAAKKLGVTPGAVSQRLKELETRLGKKLLVRTPRGVTLTRAGAALFDRMADPLREVEFAYIRATGRESEQRVVISATPSFAANWLVKRLGRFEAANRSIEVTIEASPRLVDLEADPVDLAIRHGLGEYPGLVSQWLMAPEQIVVGSPQLLKKHRHFERPEECLRYPLLHDIDRKDWAMWLKALGSHAQCPSGGNAYSDDNLLIRAAVAGQGLALVLNTYAADDLAAGRLIQPYKGSWPTRFAYYLVGTRQSLKRPAAKRFARWLVDEVSADA